MAGAIVPLFRSVYQNDCVYTQDVRRFAAWMHGEYPGLKATEVTPTDAKTLAKRLAPTTVNRALIRIGGS